jgi:hypothetical protein
LVVLHPTRMESESNERLRVPWLERGSTRGDDGDHWSSTPPTRSDAERAWPSRWSVGPPEGHMTRSRGAPPRTVAPPGKRRPLTEGLSDGPRLVSGYFGYDIRDGREIARRGLGFSEPRAGDPDHGWVRAGPEETSSVDAGLLATTSTSTDSTEHCGQPRRAAERVPDPVRCARGGPRLPQATGDPPWGGGAISEPGRRIGLRGLRPLALSTSPGSDGRPPTATHPPASDGDDGGRRVVGSTNCGQSPPGHVRFIAHGEGARGTGGDAHRAWSLVDPDDESTGDYITVSGQLALAMGPRWLRGRTPFEPHGSQPTFAVHPSPPQVASLLGAGPREEWERDGSRPQFESVNQENGSVWIQRNQEPESQCATALGAARIGPSFAVRSVGSNQMEGDV